MPFKRQLKNFQMTSIRNLLKTDFSQYGRLDTLKNSPSIKPLISIEKGKKSSEAKNRKKEKQIQVSRNAERRAKDGL